MVVLLALTASACSSNATNGDTPTTEAPKPAGRLPSEIAKMVCQAKAHGEIDAVLGQSSVVVTPTWVDHLYSCTYRYSDGQLGLSIKELDSYPQTKGYFGQLGRQLGVTQSLGGLGQGAFQTHDGSVVVRKDYKVLLVDDSGLPPEFGQPATPRGSVAVTVADVILGCWAGD